MVVSRAEIERLRTEADTIFTRIETVENALKAARSEEGDHWDHRELTLDLETPTGDPISVTVDLDRSAAENAQQRYERAGELESELNEREAIAGELAQVPPHPLAFLICYRLGTVEAEGPRTIAGQLDAAYDQTNRHCEDLETAGLLASSNDERSYRLTADGARILDHLTERAGKRKFLRWLDDARTLARRISRGGPDYPRMTATELGLELTHVRHLYRAMEKVGLVTTYEGSIIKGTERKLKPKDETHRKHTYYVTTTVADQILRNLEDESG